MPVVNHKALYTEQYVKRVDLMLRVVATKRKDHKQIMGHKKTLRGDGYVYYLGCGDSNRSVYICPNS